MIVQIIDFEHKYSYTEIETLLEIIEPILRKIAHVTIYAIGGIAIANCVWQFCSKEKVAIGISVCIGVLYASSDEMHQLMVDGRNGDIRDVIIDSMGILMGIMFFLLIKKIWKRISNRNKECKGGE